MEIRLLCGNLQVHLLGQYKPDQVAQDYGLAAGLEQLEKIKALGVDGLILQETVSTFRDPIARAGWPHQASANLRFLKREMYDCFQQVAVCTAPELPIGNFEAVDMGYLQPGGQEIMDVLESFGRQARCYTLAAEVELPDGKSFWLVSSHGPWTPNAHTGVMTDHQRLYFEALGIYLGGLLERGKPVVFSGDLNCRVIDALPFFHPAYELITPKNGLSLVLRPDHPKKQFLTDADLFVDVVLVHDVHGEVVQTIDDLSDHLLHLVDLHFD